MQWVRTVCPYVFLIFSLAATLFLAWNLPPFMAADEGAHVQRANLLTHGRLLGERIVTGPTATAGGPGDYALLDAAQPFDDMILHHERKADAIDYAAAAAVRWDGREGIIGFAASAVYPPFFYLPEGGALALGKALDQTVVRSLYLARTANALCCVGLGFVALLLAGRARLPLFALMTLPMSLALSAAVTPDGLTLMTIALAAGLISRGMSEDRPLIGREVAAATICFTLVGMTKLPYALLGLVLLACPMQRPKWRYLAVGTIIGASLAWTVWMSVAVQTPLVRTDAVLDPAGQIRFLLTHPMAVPAIAGETLAAYGRDYAASFIGVLGWMDTPMPPAYYPLTYGVLALSLLWAACLGRPAPWRWTPAAVLVASVLTAGAVFGALYVVWSPVGHLRVDGVQGRYFLPIAMLVPLIFEGRQPLLDRIPRGATVQTAIGLAVLAWPLATLLLVEHAVIVRYYLD